ncbi:MAG: preprotein translocase subunit SecG [Bdellovibrionales bacterium]
METLVTVVHILVALVLIGLVLIQDSKGGALGIGGGGGSNSVLGAGGAQTLAAKATRWVAVLFAITSIGLSVMTAHKTRSVVEGMGPIVAPQTSPQTTTPEASSNNATTTNASEATAAPTEAPKK